MKYHAVMIGEDGMEFGVDLEANTREEAYDVLAEDYPESRVDCLEDPEDSAAREADLYERVRREIDGDDDYYDDDDWEDDDE